MPLNDLYSVLEPGPKTLEPGVRSMAPMPSSTGSDLGGQSATDYTPVGGDFNPLYLLGLAGSIFTKKPGEAPGIAERALPFYLQQQAAGQERERRQELSQEAAAEYGKVQDALATAIDNTSNFSDAAKLYSQNLQQLGIKDREVAGKALAVLGQLKDKAIGQQVEQKDARVAGEVQRMEQDGSLKVNSGWAYTQALLMRGASKDFAAKAGLEREKGYQTTNQGNLASRVDWNQADPRQQYAGGYLGDAGPDRPASYTTMGPGGPVSNAVPGSPYQQTENGTTMVVDPMGQSAAPFSGSSTERPDVQQPPDTRPVVTVGPNKKITTRYDPISDPMKVARDAVRAFNPGMDENSDQFKANVYDAFQRLTPVPENSMAYNPSQRLRGQDPRLSAPSPQGTTPTGPQVQAQGPTPGVGSEPVYRGNSAPVGGDVARLVGGLSVANESIDRLMEGSSNPDVTQYQGPWARFIPEAQKYAPEWAQGITGKLSTTQYQKQKDMANVENYLLNLRSGTAVTENELARMRQELPQPLDSPENYRIGVRNTQRNIRQLNEIVKNLVLRKDKKALVESGFASPEDADKLIGSSSPSGINNPGYPDTSGGGYKVNKGATLPPKLGPGEFMFNGQLRKGTRIYDPKTGSKGWWPAEDGPVPDNFLKLAE